MGVGYLGLGLQGSKLSVRVQTGGCTRSAGVVVAVGVLVGGCGAHAFECDFSVDIQGYAKGQSLD